MTAEEAPSTGGELRIYRRGGPHAPDGCACEFFWIDDAIGEGLVRLGPEGVPEPAVAADWTREPLAGTPGSARVRWSFRLEPGARFADGSPVMPTDVVASWQRELSDGCPTSRWLLAPLLGAAEFATGRAARVEGLIEGEGRLDLLLERETPDLLLRLAHPSLRIARPGAGAALDGPGPFTKDPAGRLVFNPHLAGGRPPLDALDFVWSVHDDDPGLLLRIDEADLALVHGRGEREIREDLSAGLRAIRLPAQDRTYALWVDRASPGLRDRAVRRSLGARIDRESLVRLLYDGGGEPVGSLFPPAAGLTPQAHAGAAPTGGRLVVLFDEADPHAGTIAARIRADLLPHGAELELAPARAEAYRSHLAGRRATMAVIVHQPFGDDPLLGLRETLSPLGDQVAEALGSIDEAAAEADPAARLDAALRLEQELRDDGRLVPLIRLHAWLLARPGLCGLTVGRPERVSLEAAGWLP